MRRILLFLASLSILTAAPVRSLHAQAYQVTNLISDGSVKANTMDPNFLNPWGISVSPVWWISTANSGFNYVVNGTTDAIMFKVAVAPGSSSSATGLPAGSVTTAGASGMVLSNGAKASFLFSTLDGTISGWNGALGTATPTTLIAVNNTSAGASYPGLALLNANATTSYILAPNFGAANKIEVYDQTFKPATLSGSFTDPNLPAGYSPWSIHILNNQVWVAYALRSTTAPFVPVPGVGNGVVDVFDASGNFVARAATGGNLNAPWGVAFAPSTGFGIFAGDLLIGNFGDGKINVYDPKSFAYLGQLMDSTGKSLVYPSLWDLLPGGTPVGNSTAVSGGSLTNVYFTSGLAGEAHGLFASIANTTTTGAAPTFTFSAATSAMTVTNGNSAQTSLAIDPVNGFSGNVTFSCNGLPTGSSCTFTPPSVSVASNAVATGQVTITTTAASTMASRGNNPLHGKSTLVLSLASLLPITLLLARRRLTFRETVSMFLPLFMLSIAAGLFMVGCSDSSSSAPPTTPTGQSQIQVIATGPNSAVQSFAITLTVK